MVIIDVLMLEVVDCCVAAVVVVVGCCVALAVVGLFMSRVVDWC